MGPPTKLYSFEYKAETALAAFLQPNQSKKAKFSQKSTNLKITKFFECLDYTTLFSGGYSSFPLGPLNF
jgi:hypothetical protein